MKTLSGRYIRIFLAILVVPVFFAGTILDNRYFRQLKASALAKNQELTDQVGASLNAEISQIQILSAGLINNLYFLDSCESYELSVGSEDTHKSTIQIETHLDSFFRYTSRIGIVSLFFPSKPAIHYRNYPVAHFQKSESRDYLRSAMRNPGVNQTIPELFGVNATGIDSPMLSISVSPAATNSRFGLDAMLLSFQMPLLDEIHRAVDSLYDITVLTDDGGYVLLTNSSSIPVDLTEIDFTDSSAGKVTGASRDAYLITAASIESTGWRLYRILDYDAFVRPLRRSRSVTYLFFIFVSTVFIFYTLFFFRDLLRPLQTIIHRMSIVETGDYSASVPVEGHGEMAHLGAAFNSMTSEIRRLTVEGRAREAEKNRHEMEALQYRIHPHFVANTLNSIRIMADAEDSPHIAEMSASLMRLITESFNKGGRLISLADEKKNLESYIHIMKVRFGELIDLSFSLPDELLEQNLLKMMLQPIVENSVLHGIRECDRPGVIRIAAVLEEATLAVTVEDNGAGMSEEQLNDVIDVPLEDHPRGLTRIGIHNVHRRIQLNYGAGFGLSISSRLGEGTSVTLRVPAWLEGDA